MLEEIKKALIETLVNNTKDVPLFLGPKELSDLTGNNITATRELFHRKDFPAVWISEKRAKVSLLALLEWSMTRKEYEEAS